MKEKPVISRLTGFFIVYQYSFFINALKRWDFPHIEQSEQVEDEALAKIANALSVIPEAIKLFSEEAIFYIKNSADTASGNTIVNYQFQFNPIEKIVELYNEKVALLKLLLQSELEKVEMPKSK